MSSTLPPSEPEGRPPTLPYASTRDSRSGPDASLAICLLLLLLYGVVYIVAIMVLEPGMTPPGFTGRGVYGLLIILAGSAHAGRYGRARWIYFVYGCLAVVPLFGSYLTGRAAMELAAGGNAVWIVLAEWCLGALVTGVLAVVCSRVGANLAR